MICASLRSYFAASPLMTGSPKIRPFAKGQYADKAMPKRVAAANNLDWSRWDEIQPGCRQAYRPVLRMPLPTF